MKRSRVTTDHDDIREWAEARGGKPTAVKGTSRGKRDVGMIRIDFPGYSGEGKLAPISWDKWFEKFDESNLAMIYEEKTAKGQKSNFNKLVARESVEPSEGGKGTRGGKAKSRRATRRTRVGGGAASSTRSSAKRSTSRTSRSTASKRTSATKRGSASKRSTASKRGAGKTSRGTRRT